MRDGQLSIAEIKARNPLEAVAAQYGLRLHSSGSGQRLVALCPFHQEKTPSFMIYLHSQHYYCFGCGAHGDVIHFVEVMTSCSYNDALMHLSHSSSNLEHILPLTQSNMPHNRRTRPTPLVFSNEQKIFLTRVQEYYHQTLLMRPRLREWLWRNRGISQEGIERSRLGYANGDLNKIQLSLPQRRIAHELGILRNEHEFLARRLIIPEINAEGHCSWLIGRRLADVSFQGRPLPLKYLGLSLPKPLLGSGIANRQLHENLRQWRAILLVEGAFDYMLAAQWELALLPCALLATHASRNQLQTLQDIATFGSLPILLCLDADRPGQTGSKHLQEILSQAGCRVATVPLPHSCNDLGDLGKRQDGRNIFARAIEQTLRQISRHEGK